MMMRLGKRSVDNFNHISGKFEQVNLYLFHTIKKNLNLKKKNLDFHEIFDRFEQVFKVFIVIFFVKNNLINVYVNIQDSQFQNWVLDQVSNIHTYFYIFFHFSLDFHKRQTASMMRMGKRSVPDTDNQESADRIYRLLMNKRQTSSMMRMGKRSGKLNT